MPHGLDADEAHRRIERAARDLSEGRFAKLKATVEAPAPGRVRLAGAREGSRFEADITIGAATVTVAIKGALELSFLEVTLAGGAAGVRRRVLAEVERALKD